MVKRMAAFVCWIIVGIPTFVFSGGSGESVGLGGKGVVESGESVGLGGKGVVGPGLPAYLAIIVQLCDPCSLK